MSFNNSLPLSQWQSSLASSDSKSRARLDKTSQSVWDQSVSGTSGRRLSPLATSDLTSTGTTGQRGQRQESQASPASLSSTVFPSLTSASSKFGSSRPPTSSTFSIAVNSSGSNQAGATHNQGQITRQVTSPSARSITPLSHSTIAGVTNNFQTGSGVGGGGVGILANRPGSYSPSSAIRDHRSPSKPSLERSTGSSSAGTSSTSQSSFSKISATQIVLLLDTISEKDGPVKWEGKAEKIRNLLNSNGTEVFAQFLRRAVILNQQAIFGGQKDFDRGSYKLLQERIKLVEKDPSHAYDIADAIDTAREGDFRDFELGLFTQHFLQDPVSQAALVIAFTFCARNDLRLKAEQILQEISPSCLRTLSGSDTPLSKYSLATLASILTYYALSLPSSEGKAYDIPESVIQKIIQQHGSVDSAVMAASNLWRIPDSDRQLVDALRKAGPKSLSKSSLDDIVSSMGQNSISETEVANALLFVTLTQPPLQYNAIDLVASIRKSTQLHWNAVLRTLDVIGARITTDAFAKLFNALLPVAIDDGFFDIQKLWGGVWTNPLSQLSFLRAFLSSSPKDVKIDRIPHLRLSLAPNELEGLSPDIQKQLKAQFDGQYMSQDAFRAILDVVLSSDQTTEEDDGNAILQDVVQNHMEAFILCLAQLPRPTTTMQENFIERCFMMHLNKLKDNSSLFLDALFKQSPEFTNFLCTLCFHNDPRRTEIIYERAEELGWTGTFLQAVATPLALDLACMRHKLRKEFDLSNYIDDAVSSLSPAERVQYGNTLWKYLRIKADDEYRVQREQIAPQSVPLSLKSVYTFLDKLQDLVNDREQLKAAQTTCLQTYPRLLNYAAGKDEILERRSEERGNKLPEEIDAQMSELFGRMYRSEVSIRDMISEIRRYKTADEPELQDLFCCIVHGLFDEYICYSEYPEDALEKTALLFGNIIKYNLLPEIPQEYGLTLIVDAVKDHEQDSAMHRFGVEALLQINERLPEWPSLCRSLLQIPSLQQPEIIAKAEEGVQNDHIHLQSTNGADDQFATANGSGVDISREGGYRPFRSLTADMPLTTANLHDPDEKSQEKILFVINNLSMDNMMGKLNDLKDVLKPEHYQWFAAYLVEQRARLEPNNQQMYIEFLSKLNDKNLLAEVIRETYTCVVKMMNAKSTLDSATERTHLKNLGDWLGSLTVAQDRPIRHHNLYFIDLLLEGFDTQRLVFVIPFTCKVLVQGARSTVFKPPNPWLMEIIGLLLELYHFAELKLNLKFEIEVLCKELKLDHKKLEPATIIRERPQQIDDDLTNTSGVVEGIEGFEELSLNGPMNRGTRKRISAQDIMAGLPSLDQVLRFPPLPGTLAEQEMVKNIILRAIDNAIQEIIAPVVERSITIASISTAQLVAKDYSLEPNVEYYRTAARQTVKGLAGSLALVTCKEPLRMSITNNIRRPVHEEVPEHLMSEGSILMCVNDNLDIACSFVEQAAQERAMMEIEQVIESELEERRRFVAENPGRDYYSANVSRWSTWIPEPYKQTVGGLNDSQRAVYEDFDRRVNGMNAGHLQNTSTDSTGRQIPDVLQEALAMPVLSTPADQPAIPHQSPMTRPDSQSRSHASQPPRVNGFPDTMAPHERISVLLEEIQKHARNMSNTRLKDAERDGVIFQNVRQLLIVLTASSRPAADHIARQTAEKICHTFLVKPPRNTLEAELLAFLLHKLCMLSELITRDVMRWTTASEEVLLGNSNVTAALMAVGLMHPARVDSVIASALKDHNETGLQLLSELMNLILFDEEPLSLRADFAKSIVEVYNWLKEQPDLQLAIDITEKLKAQGIPQYVTTALSDKAKAKSDQVQYIFREWVALYENLPFVDDVYASFLCSMHDDQVINNSEDLALLLRLCVDMCIDRFEIEAQSYRGSVTAAFSLTDALALLLIMMLKFQRNTDGAVKKSKASYLDTLLGVIILLLNHHVETRGTAFNQRIFARLLNSMLHEYSITHLDRDPEHNALVMSFLGALKSLSPMTFPGFVYGWMGLIMNRVLVETVLRSDNMEMREAYRDILGEGFLFLGTTIGITEYEGVHEGIVRGMLRNVWVLRHDYPDFLSENHIYFCARIHHAFPQLRNLILTSRPISFIEEVDPLTPGLKIDRIEQIKKTPVQAGNIDSALKQEGVLSVLQSLTRKSDSINSANKLITDMLIKLDDEKAPSSVRNEFAEYVVSWLIIDATSDHEKFDASSPQTQLLTKVISSANPQSRYLLCLALADHLRFPNAQTEYALRLFLHLWNNASNNEDQGLVRETLMRVLCDLLIFAKPHPWGLIVVFQELTSNPAFGFWDDKGFGSEDLKSKLVTAIRGH